ncbi:MAG TPA: hypothetical protein VN132_08295, partial [Bdellovibrio sp.]|nr:hypothetical protein [Bdellovibrio sp.]
MKARVLLSLLFFLSTSVLAKNLDGTLWAVKKKSCEGKDVAISAEEKVQFGNEMFAYISRSSETSKDYCDEALAYQRNIRSTSELEDRYTEVSFLSQYSVRTVCRNKQIDAVIS